MSSVAAVNPDSVPVGVALQGIRKSFSGVPVLRGIDLTISTGEVLGLVGENGAGKSTLMNILGGDVRPDAGSMSVDDVPYRPVTPSDARARGIAFVHQELTLFGNLTIAENLQLARFPRRGWTPFIDRAASAGEAALLLRRVGLAREPATLVDRLSAGERQLVEIARSLGGDARVLILDEPTTSLGASERDRLHALIRELRDAGLSIVYISHELGDVLSIADRIAVLRDGAVVASGSAADFSVTSLVRHMVGREVQRLYPPRRSTPRGDPVLELRHVVRRGATQGINLTLHRHEILGVFGLMGAGRSELARVIFGLDRHASGDILLDGAPLDGGPAERIARGVAFVTEDRRLEGLCLEAAVADNLVLASLRVFSRTALGIIDRAAMHRSIRQIRADVRLGVADEATPVARLSGGNQQKVVLGKWLLTRPRVLILDEPTRGIDVGARAEIYQLLHRLADDGAGLLVISSSLDELMGMCDRIVAMRQGEIGGRFEAGDFDRERLLRAALPTRVGNG
ncbi:MAG: sugar ABC transporter ATP-binding protein [Acidobacteriota bacterium]|nr:sugar ABC transporter ATP-binding protein [Acidobacteriota bacterium]